ncbi:MAG: cardiolipin synthase [Desulfobacteraceae bacterium]|nr:cardiolipin synthase [Desulfobacteraceae bacterium]MCF8095718.1 cardiolipin synthase [Desulfobacteraceae bacterium]
MPFIHWTILVLNLALSLLSAGHALFFKRTPQSALGWVAVCLAFPFVGPVIYFIFGINRIRQRARKLEIKRPPQGIEPGGGRSIETVKYSPGNLEVSRAAADIARISDNVTRLPLVGGNRIKSLYNGEKAYPAMIKTIEHAKERVFLGTYIFDTDSTGRKMIDALADAQKRGVKVCVIVDGFGELYSSPRASTLLARAGVPCARFLPPRLLPFPMLHINLSTHRKTLVADGEIGYTGGMNIGDRHLVDAPKNRKRVADTHFRFEGPVVRQLEHSFLEDWYFCTGESVEPTASHIVSRGTAVCRTITDGPNEPVDKLSTILVGAVATARRRVMIMTPYFLPSVEMISAIQTSVLRGTRVDIVLPAKNNLPYIQWASNNMLWELLYWGANVYFQPPPFVHSKLFVTDEEYAQIGSANIDPRSLKLNFELNVEIFDRETVDGISAHIDNRIEHSRQIYLGDIDNRSFPVKTRDALMWLFSPYL